VIRCFRRYRRRLFLPCDSGVSEGLFIAEVCIVYIVVGIVCLRATEEDARYNTMDEADSRRCLRKVTTSFSKVTLNRSCTILVEVSRIAEENMIR